LKVQPGNELPGEKNGFSKYLLVAAYQPVSISAKKASIEIEAISVNHDLSRRRLKPCG
jgi:hypothetical protein